MNAGEFCKGIEFKIHCLFGILFNKENYSKPYCGHWDFSVR